MWLLQTKIYLNIDLINLEKTSKNNALGSRLISGSGIATPILAATIEMAGKTNPKTDPVFSLITEVAKDASLYLYILFLMVFFLGKYFTRNGDKVIWETLQSQIDILQSIAFPDHANELNDHHRVTLFRYKKWCWNRLFNLKSWNRPWSGWLVPVIRSGHTGKGTKVVFLAPDSGSDAEGIAGLCWSSDAIISRENMKSINSSSSDQNKGEYCRRSNMPRSILDSYCKNNRPLARNILAFPVRTCTGNRWGVLVYDSMSLSSLDIDTANKAFEIVIEPIGVLVEGIK